MAPWQITISCRVEEDDHGSARPGRAWRGRDVRPGCGFVGWRVAGRRWPASTETRRGFSDLSKFLCVEVVLPSVAVFGLAGCGVAATLVVRSKC